MLDRPDFYCPRLAISSVADNNIRTNSYLQSFTELSWKKLQFLKWRQMNAEPYLMTT